MKRFKAPHLARVVAAQWDALQAVLREPGDVMPHELVTKIGVDRVSAVAIFTALAEAQCGELLLLIYWADAGEQPIAARPLKKGFPRVPMYVEANDEYVLDPEQLTYDYMLRVREGIELER